MYWSISKFLKEHEGEWYTPHEIAKELKSDIRTVKNDILRLRYRHYETTYKGYRLDVAERRRIYAIRMIKDVAGSIRIIEEEMAEVRSIPEVDISSIYESRSLIEKHCGCLAIRNIFRHYLHQSYHSDKNVAQRNLEKLRNEVQRIKNDKLERLESIKQDLIA